MHPTSINFFALYQLYWYSIIILKLITKVMKVSIDETKCIMCGSCVAICPEVFEMKDDEKVDVKNDGEVAQEDSEKVKEAQTNCPTTAIEVKE